MIKGLIISAILLLSNKSFSSEAIGYYSKNGKLQNSQKIDSFDQTNIVKLYRKRGQNFGTTEVMSSLVGTANFIKELESTVERMQIGDIAAKYGGRINRHASHQNGLDADVVYFRVNEKEQKRDFPEWKELFVKNGELTKNFHLDRNWQAFKYLVHNHRVGRIFVDPVVKKSLCKYAKEIGEFKSELEVLRTLRPLNSHHASHFHLRLVCPREDKNCKRQPAPGPGSGC